MDNQDQGKNHSSGHESHLCNKCGWPFPNPHPSAKHRRAHKKICGKVEGYKLVDSGNISHRTASDDEPLSEEDKNTPIAKAPKVMESGFLEKSIGGIGAVSNRSEDEVFSDAAMEFQESGFGFGRQDSMDNAKDLFTPTVSFKDCEDTDILQPPDNSVDGIQNKNPVLKSIPIQSTGTLEHRDLGLSYSNDSEERKDFPSGIVPFKTEPLMGISEENGKVSASDRVAECSVGQENNADEGKSTKTDIGALILPGEDAGEISETVSLSEKGPDRALLKEEFSDKLDFKTSLNENGDQLTDREGNPGTTLERNLTDVVASNIEHESESSEKTVDVTLESGLASKIAELEENNEECALSAAIGDLSPELKSAKYTDASTATFRVQTDETQGTESATPINSSEVYGTKERENESFYVLSVPDDIPVVDNSEIKLESFKDHSRVKLPQLETLASEEINIEYEVRDGVSQEKSDTSQSIQLDEDIKVGSSYMHDAEGGNNEPVAKRVLVEGETDVIQAIKGSDALGSRVGTDTIEDEKDQKDCSLEEQLPVCLSDDLQKTSFSGSMINVIPDVDPMIAHADIEARKLDIEVGSDDKGFPERARNGVLDIAEGDNIIRVDDQNCVENTGVLNESANDSSLSQTNPASNLVEGENSDDIGTGNTEKCDINVVDPGDGLEEGCFSMKTNSTPDSISTHQSPVVTEEVNNGCVRTLPESEHLELMGDSNSHDSMKSEINRDNKVLRECADENLMASTLDNSGGNEFETTSEDQLKKESMLPPSYAEPTSQSSGAVDDSHTRESGMDVSNESSSQTDSLEGHWGSVSDNPAGSHEVPEAEKANIKDSKVASVERAFDKSEEFEPPSFMTLVEPVGNDGKAASSEIQTAQNAQDPNAAPLRTGWFPSLTHVAKESQGRKKNEEMIEKVTNWNVKQHTPLKNLLGEGDDETKPKSPNSTENRGVVILREEKAAEDNGGSVTKVSSILGPETPTETGKEWNSPARYPADIKREKRKVKGRPLWTQFVCCSSVN